MYELKKWEEQVLTVKAKACEMSAGELDGLATAMLEICQENGGVGLAAPQVGASVCVILINTLTVKRFVVNPVISPIMKRGTKVSQEGCLSYPGKLTRRKRWKQIRVKGTNIDGSPVDEVFKGMVARIVQHEVDHLNGVVV